MLLIWLNSLKMFTALEKAGWKDKAILIRGCDRETCK
jgi:hypothetical protein